MCVSGIRNRLVVLLSFFMSIPLISARGQDQRPAATRKGFETHYTSPSPYQKWLDEDVRWIITDEERAEYSKLATDQQRDHFVEAFWERRNPTPGAPDNMFKEEHYRRLAYANQHFAAGVPGWKTDRGRFYIIYGPPDEIVRHLPSDKAHLDEIQKKNDFPSEEWHWEYIEGLGRDVTLKFVDTCGCGQYHLVSGANGDH